MLRWRLLSSAIIIAILLVLIWLDLRVNFGHPGIWLAPLVVVIAALAAGEVLGLLHAQNLHPVSWTVYGGTLAVIAFACAPMLWKDYPVDCPFGKFGWPLAGMALGVGLAFVGELQRFQEAGKVVVNVALSVFVIAYVGLLMAFLAALRFYHDNLWGMVALLSLAIIVKVSDTGAYMVGRLLGKHKMAPVLSPKKTIEGAIGGIVTACLCSWLLFRYIVPVLVEDPAPIVPVWASMLYGLVIAIAGMLGDLAESLLKRDAGEKDSSTWMPGLGGVLDVMDSVLAAAPAAFVFWTTGLLGP